MYGDLCVVPAYQQGSDCMTDCGLPPKPANLQRCKKEELVEYLAAHGVDLGSSATKDECISYIRNMDDATGQFSMDKNPLSLAYADACRFHELGRPSGKISDILGPALTPQKDSSFGAPLTLVNFPEVKTAGDVVRSWARIERCREAMSPEQYGRVRSRFCKFKVFI